MAEDLRLAPDRDGWTSLHQAWAMPPMGRHHRHEELEVNLVGQGLGEYLGSGRRVRFPPQGLGWLLPHQPHRLIDQSAGLRMWIGVFRPGLVVAGAGDVSPPRAWLGESPPSDEA